MNETIKINKNGLIYEWIDKNHDIEWEYLLEEEIKDEYDFNDRVKFYNEICEALGYSKTTWEEYKKEVKEWLK